MPPVCEASDMFNLNPMHSSDKLVLKRFCEETLLKLDLEPKGQGHSKNVNWAEMSPRVMLNASENAGSSTKCRHRYYGNSILF